MDPHIENTEPSPLLFNEYLHKIKDLNLLDDAMILQISRFTKEEKMEIIIAMNHVIYSLISILE